MYRYSIQWKINIFKSFCFSLASSNFKSAPAPAKTPRLRPAPQHWYFLYLLRKCFENSRLELAPIIFLLPGTVYPAPQDWLLETTISVFELLKDKKTKLKISLINTVKKRYIQQSETSYQCLLYVLLQVSGAQCGCARGSCRTWSCRWTSTRRSRSWCSTPASRWSAPSPTSATRTGWPSPPHSSGYSGH